MRDTCDGEGVLQTTNINIVNDSENYSGKINQ